MSSIVTLPRIVGAGQTMQTVMGSDPLPNSLPEQAPDDSTTRSQEDQRGYTDQQLLEEARKFLDYCETAEGENRQRAVEMLRFCYKRGSQWPDKIKRERESDNRPCLEINQMPAFINQVLNDQRQNRPAIKIRPASSDATEQMAELRQDLIRHIEYESNSDIAKDTAFRYAVAANAGYIRVTTEYEDEKSFNQKLCIKPVRNPQTVWFDPDCTEVDGSDAERVLVAEEFSKEEFERRWPDASPVDWQSTDPTLTAWLKPNTIRVGEYIHKVRHKERLYLLVDGRTKFRSELDAEPDLEDIIASRLVDRCEVCIEVINGIEILEKYTWPGEYLPIVPCFGDVTDVEGEIIRQGLIDRAVDQQQLYNFLVSSAAEAAANQPKAPFLVAEGQVDQRERDWGESNVKNRPYLVYRRFDESGKDLGQPQRQSPDVDVTGMLAQATRFQQDMRLAVGIADPLAQLQTQDESGRAILAKERIQSTATYHFSDNLTRCIRLLGKVLLDAIPHIYDTHRVLQLLKEDGSQYRATINQPQPVPDGMGEQPRPLNDMTLGNYDVVVDVGPSYASKRVEFVNSVMELTQSNPAMWQVAGDLLVKNMDWPGADDVASRLQVMLPAPIQQMIASKSDDPQAAALATAFQQFQQQTQQQMQAMGAQMQELQQKNQQLQSQGYQKDMKLAGAGLELQKRDMAMAQKNQEAQADVITQMMESRDVQAKILQEDRKSHAEAFKMMSEAMAKQREAQLDERELNIKAFSSVAEAIAKLGPLMQPGIALAEKETPNVERETAQPAGFDPGPMLEHLTGLHQEAMNGMGQALQGLMQQGAQTHAVLRDLSKPKPSVKPKRKVYRIRKSADGGYEGEAEEVDDGQQE